MPPADSSLPEGTDTIIDGAAQTDTATPTRPSSDAATGAAMPDATDGGATSGGARDGGDPRAMFFAKIDELRGQAGDSARDFAQAGKDRISSALDDAVRMIEDTAGEIDARIGTNYGDYARRAAQGVGGFADAFKGKDVDDLFAEGRALLERSPAVAMGAAAALGFVIARLVRSGAEVAAAGKDTRKA